MLPFPTVPMLILEIYNHNSSRELNLRARSALLCDFCSDADEVSSKMQRLSAHIFLFLTSGAQAHLTSALGRLSPH